MREKKRQERGHAGVAAKEKGGRRERERGGESEVRGNGNGQRVREVKERVLEIMF